MQSTGLHCVRIYYAYSGLHLQNTCTPINEIRNVHTKGHRDSEIRKHLGLNSIPQNFLTLNLCYYPNFPEP